MPIHRTIFAVLIASLLASSAFSQPAVWSNPATGVGAGVWSNPANWSPAVVPGTLNTAQIKNGGEAKVTSNVSASRIEVGKNGGTGIFTSTTPGITISTRVDFDTGEIGGGVATGPITVTSSGTTTITDATSLVIGTTGNGELDVGQANATLGATANSTGLFTVERVPLVQVADNAEIGQASGSATANGDGTVNANNIGTFDVGKALNVGVAANSSGLRNATGTFNSSFINLLMVKDDFALGQAFSSGNQGISNVTASITDAGTIDVGGSFQVGVAVAKGGGTAQASSTLDIQRATSLQVGNEFNIGRISSESAPPTGSAISGQADTLAVTATLTDVTDISATSGVFVGRAFTRDNAEGSADGTLTIDTANSITIGADLDVGQTGSSGIATIAGVTTTGTGDVTLRNVTGTVSITGDIDVGTTGGANNTTTNGNGTLLVENVGTLDVTVDLDVGQTSGAGNSTGVGMATIRSVPSVTIGDDIDVGFTSGSSGGVNNGTGTLVASDSSFSIGFADPLFPGSLHLGNASPTLGQSAMGHGTATFERSTISVGKNVTVGKLSGGSNDANNSSQGSLDLIDSALTSAALDVATVFDATSGTSSGTLHLDSSLVTVSGAMTLGPNALLEFGLAGTTKADGTGAPGQFSAINAGAVTLDGDLSIFLVDGFIPSAGDSFQIVSGLRSGTFGPVSFPSLPGGLSWDIQYDPNAVILEVLSATLTGDYNGNGIVDAADYTVWLDALGQTGSGLAADGNNDLIVNQTDYDLWKSNFGATSLVAKLAVTIPEPTTQLLFLFGFVLFASQQNRWNRNHRHMSQWEVY